MIRYTFQVVTLVNDADAKRVGMVEVINGGTTSFGAQMRAFQTPVPITIRSADGRSHETRGMSMHCVTVTGDYPAINSLLPSKCSVKAHCFDRHSTLDQESASLLPPHNYSYYSSYYYDTTTSSIRHCYYYLCKAPLPPLPPPTHPPTHTLLLLL